MGKLLIRKSGKVQLLLGKVTLDVTMGTACSFLQVGTSYPPGGLWLGDSQALQGWSSGKAGPLTKGECCSLLSAWALVLAPGLGGGCVQGSHPCLIPCRSWCLSALETVGRGT